MDIKEFYNYCKKKFMLDNITEVTDLLYRSSVNLSNNKFDIGTFDPEIWIKENDKFIKA